MIWQRLQANHWVGQVTNDSTTGDYVAIGHEIGWLVIAPNGDMYPGASHPDFESAVATAEQHAAGTAPPAPLKL